GKILAELFCKLIYMNLSLKKNLEPLAKVGHSVIPGRASLARNDDFLLLSRVLQEPHTLVL
ncbi:MAG: hypothetical protein NTV04_20890, partial [Deltaproteobacteria bacterium]|nr:hypothetical protein [Deltaproteobacteria bacterium]